MWTLAATTALELTQVLAATGVLTPPAPPTFFRERPTAHRKIPSDPIDRAGPWRFRGLREVPSVA